MKLEEMPTKDLLALHNRIADKPAGPKTFATRTKLVARIEQVAADKNIDLASFGQPKKPKATAQRAEPKAEATETPEAAEKKPRGLGVGALARAILMDPAGQPVTHRRAPRRAAAPRCTWRAAPPAGRARRRASPAGRRPTAPCPRP